MAARSSCVMAVSAELRDWISAGLVTIAGTSLCLSVIRGRTRRPGD